MLKVGIIGYGGRVSNMAKRLGIYGGDKPFDLRCDDCGEQVDCPESQFNLFYERHRGDRVVNSPKRMCMFSEGIQNEDLGIGRRSRILQGGNAGVTEASEVPPRSVEKRPPPSDRCHSGRSAVKRRASSIVGLIEPLRPPNEALKYLSF